VQLLSCLASIPYRYSSTIAYAIRALLLDLLSCVSDTCGCSDGFRRWNTRQAKAASWAYGDNIRIAAPSSSPAQLSRIERSRLVWRGPHNHGQWAAPFLPTDPLSAVSIDLSEALHQSFPKTGFNTGARTIKTSKFQGPLYRLPEGHYYYHCFPQHTVNGVDAWLHGWFYKSYSEPSYRLWLPAVAEAFRHHRPSPPSTGTSEF
jgi:hypothetical protein